MLSASIYLSFLKPLPKQALYEKGTHWVWWHRGSPRQILVMVMCACGGLKVKQEVSSNKILPVQQEMSSWLNNEAVGPDGSKPHHVSFLRCLCIRFILHGASVSQMRVTVVCSHMLNGVSLHKDPVSGSVIQVGWRMKGHRFASFIRCCLLFYPKSVRRESHIHPINMISMTTAQ